MTTRPSGHDPYMPPIPDASLPGGQAGRQAGRQVSGAAAQAVDRVSANIPAAATTAASQPAATALSTQRRELLNDLTRNFAAVYTKVDNLLRERASSPEVQLGSAAYSWAHIRDYYTGFRIAVWRYPSEGREEMYTQINTAIANLNTKMRQLENSVTRENIRELVEQFRDAITDAARSIDELDSSVVCRSAATAPPIAATASAQTPAATRAASSAPERTSRVASERIGRTERKGGPYAMVDVIIRDLVRGSSRTESQQHRLRFANEYRRNDFTWKENMVRYMHASIQKISDESTRRRVQAEMVSFIRSI